jgi:hypothetical protein
MSDRRILTKSEQREVIAQYHHGQINVRDVMQTLLTQLDAWDIVTEYSKKLQELDDATVD